MPYLLSRRAARDRNAAKYISREVGVRSAIRHWLGQQIASSLNPKLSLFKYLSLYLPKIDHLHFRTSKIDP
jgi:hypothetical protein